MSTDLLRLPKLKIQSPTEDHTLCKTPCSKENKIPAVVSCPPAPKKPKTRPLSCKRKLSPQFQFLEMVNRDEVDAFFKAAFDDSHSKRRCPCI
ncbi:hypothetical protein ERO13_D04G021300v2 [Gossypium hirsutum]|uniref:Cyclin-dependent protein kinase inhibitor n=1 Tax=Gossypium tomentosum TaxID=34277 RepID=A0A5D2L8I1_GOSTO|nr:hypothetical protein ERO13_D04G021300v2 [Gossypium hirsutum]TYH75557.1 hypothetical protein ES332_D04G027200v1 [Gossypium tomentosum]